MKNAQVLVLIVCTSAIVAVAAAATSRTERTYVIPPPQGPGGNAQQLPELPGVPNVKQIYEQIYGKLPLPPATANMEGGSDLGDLFPIPNDIGNIVYTVQETSIRVITWIMNTLADILDNVVHIRKLIENTIGSRYPRSRGYKYNQA